MSNVAPVPLTRPAPLTHWDQACYLPVIQNVVGALRVGGNLLLVVKDVICVIASAVAALALKILTVAGCCEESYKNVTQWLEKSVTKIKEDAISLLKAIPLTLVPLYGTWVIYHKNEAYNKELEIFNKQEVGQRSHLSDALRVYQTDPRSQVDVVLEGRTTSHPASAVLFTFVEKQTNPQGFLENTTNPCSISSKDLKDTLNAFKTLSKEQHEALTQAIASFKILQQPIPPTSPTNPSSSGSSSSNSSGSSSSSSSASNSSGSSNSTNSSHHFVSLSGSSTATSSASSAALASGSSTATSPASSAALASGSSAALGSSSSAASLSSSSAALGSSSSAGSLSSSSAALGSSSSAGSLSSSSAALGSSSSAGSLSSSSAASLSSSSVGSLSSSSAGSLSSSSAALASDSSAGSLSSSSAALASDSSAALASDVGSSFSTSPPGNTNSTTGTTSSASS